MWAYVMAWYPETGGWAGWPRGCPAHTTYIKEELTFLPWLPNLPNLPNLFHYKFMEIERGIHDVMHDMDIGKLTCKTSVQVG